MVAKLPTGEGHRPRASSPRSSPPVFPANPTAPHPARTAQRGKARAAARLLSRWPRYPRRMPTGRPARKRQRFQLLRSSSRRFRHNKAFGEASPYPAIPSRSIFRNTFSAALRARPRNAEYIAGVQRHHPAANLHRAMVKPSNTIYQHFIGASVQGRRSGDGIELRPRRFHPAREYHAFDRRHAWR